MSATAEAPTAPQKLLVMELAGLGDNVHLLPALWLVRRQCPDAQLHVMVNAHVASLFKLTPWVDRVWSYPSAPKPGLGGILRRGGEPWFDTRGRAGPRIPGCAVGGCL
jgi:hypothetical protein